MTLPSETPLVVTLGVHILDVLGRPVTQIPPGQGSVLLEEIRITAAGTAAGTGVDLAKLGARVIAMGAIGERRHRGHAGVAAGAARRDHPAPRPQDGRPALPVAVVDTTGCGDAYSAGFIIGLARGWQPQAAAWLEPRPPRWWQPGSAPTRPWWISATR